MTMKARPVIVQPSMTSPSGRAGRLVRPLLRQPPTGP
jgi:hypothetical protein